MNSIFSIGHSTNDWDVFLNLLKKNEINCVVDVRSVPYSKYASQFNKEKIKKKLELNNIKYEFMGKTLGARQTDKELFDNDGILDFEKVLKLGKFKDSINEIIKNLENGTSVALMCSEKEPISCHRSILISRSFFNKNIVVKHILGDGSIETHEELEQELLKLYDFPCNNQVLLFKNSSKDAQTSLDFFNNNSKENSEDKCYIEEAYKKRNKEIGYYSEKYAK
ncbi:MAG: DUF488 family protein [Methanobacteriaceae archaeon]